jgi:hypothetical protein
MFTITTPFNHHSSFFGKPNYKFLGALQSHAILTQFVRIPLAIPRLSGYPIFPHLVQVADFLYLQYFSE